MGSKVVVLAIVAGAAAGMGGSVLISWLSGPSRPEALAQESPVAVASARPAEPGAGRGSSAPLSEEESLVLATKEQEDALTAHEHEDVDPGWAREAAASFTSDLAELGASAPFQIVNVDCRRASCVAALRWRSYGDARRESKSVLHRRFKVNCGSMVFLPPPPDQDAPYEAKVVFGPCEGRS